jgi:hypothetical protein
MPMFAVAATPPSVLSAGVLGYIGITTIAVVGDLPSHLGRVSSGLVPRPLSSVCRTIKSTRVWRTSHSKLDQAGSS